MNDIERAIETMKYNKHILGMPEQGTKWRANANTMACDLAIEALEKQLHYNANGNHADIEKAIEKLRSADSHHTQAQYNLDDETIEMAIAALEKQMLKKPTLNEIEKALAYLNDSLKYAEKTDNAKEVKSIINTAISALEKQLIGGWIAVSERLPSEDGYYLVSCKGGNIHTDFFWCDNGNGSKHNNTWLNTHQYEIIAWQPLPEPFKGVEQ